MDTSQNINWLLVRGLSRETRHWGTFPHELKKSYPHSHIHVLELPGVGLKYHQDTPSKIEGFVENLRNDFIKIQKEFPNQAWGLICVSLGGMIGISWFDTYPQDFKFLVTINSSGANLSWPWERLKPKAIKAISKLFLKNDLEERERTILELTTQSIPLTDSLVKKWVSYAEEYPLRREAFLKQIYAASTFKVPDKLLGPMLCLAGAKDELTDPKCSKVLASHFKCPLEVHPESGHDLPLEDPQWICFKIKSWTDKC